MKKEYKIPMKNLEVIIDTATQEYKIGLWNDRHDAIKINGEVFKFDKQKGEFPDFYKDNVLKPKYYVPAITFDSWGINRQFLDSKKIYELHQENVSCEPYRQPRSMLITEAIMQHTSTIDEERFKKDLLGGAGFFELSPSFPQAKVAMHDARELGYVGSGQTGWFDFVGILREDAKAIGEKMNGGEFDPMFVCTGEITPEQFEEFSKMDLGKFKSVEQRKQEERERIAEDRAKHPPEIKKVEEPIKEVNPYLDF